MNAQPVNMFTAKKIRLHGMQSSQWCTKDKILQYRGLINLYTRDRHIMEADTNINRKKMHRELLDLQKQVHTDRLELDNAVKGDKQKLRNILADHRALQLAYQNSHPMKIMENVNHLNFVKRKALDKLKYNKKLKSGKLIDLKLEQSVLEDRLKYAFLGQIKQEKQAQIITGKVQDATLRKEGALAINRIYMKIIDIMKKDALYFDVIIASITADGFNQSKCFLGATKLGQLATEYLDDRRQEYTTLEQIILKDLTTRTTDLYVLGKQLTNAADGIKNLLRKDSDITVCGNTSADPAGSEVLRKELNVMEDTLSFLKTATLVPAYDAIYPCLQEQLKQNKRLKHLAKKCEHDRDKLLNKTNHADTMASVLQNTMIESTTEYRTRKKELLASVAKFEKEKSKLRKVIQSKYDLKAKLRTALRQLLQISHHIRGEDEVYVKKKLLHKYDDDGKLAEIPEDETDGCAIIKILTAKFSFLMSNYHEKLKGSKVDAFELMETLMEQYMIQLELTQKKLSATSLLQGLYTETDKTLTNEDIKKQSKEIVDANKKNDDLIPMFSISAPKHKLKSAKTNEKK